AALNAAAAVAARAHAVALHVELVVVLQAGEVGAGEAGADLEALAGRQAEHRLRQVGLEPVENRLTPARRAPPNGAGDRTAERIAGLTRRLDRLDHRLGDREIGAADRRAV